MNSTYDNAGPDKEILAEVRQGMREAEAELADRVDQPERTPGTGKDD